MEGIVPESSYGSGYSWWSGGYYGYSSESKYRYTSSLGWGSGRLEETTSYYGSKSYSGFSSSDMDTNILIFNKATKAARDLVNIMDFPYVVSIALTGRIDHYDLTTGRYVFVPTSVLDSSDYNDSEKINIFCGLAVHEACHLKYTEVLVYEDFLKKVLKDSGKEDILKKESNEDKGSEPENSEENPEDAVTKSYIDLLKVIFNLVEDERIETEFLSERPGFGSFIDKAKMWQYKSFVQILSKEENELNTSKFILNLFRLLRYPSEIDTDILNAYSDSYKKIKDILVTLPKCTKDSCIMSFKIVSLIKKLFNEELHFKIEDIEHLINQANNCLYNNISNGSDIYDAARVPFSADSLKISSKLRSSILEDIIIGSAEKIKDTDVYFKKEKDKKERYLNDKKYISKYIPSIKNLIKNNDKNYDFTIHGCRQGLLDPTKLAEAYQGVPQVYMRQGHVTTNKCTVCILVDESGSMGYTGYGWGDVCRSTLARRAAILLNEALKDLSGVDLYIYGHTADITSRQSTDLYVYREGKSYCPKYSLGNINGRNENRDGSAIYQTALRVRNHTKDNCIMFVISDGEPCANGYYGSEARADVRSNVTKVENMGFTVIQISIDKVYGVEKMFTNYIDISSDISNLPIRLSKIIKKAIVDNKKTVIS